jgi:hypothetical protein
MHLYVFLASPAEWDDSSTRVFRYANGDVRFQCFPSEAYNCISIEGWFGYGESPGPKFQNKSAIAQTQIERKMNENDMEIIADFIARVLIKGEDPESVGREVIDFRLPKQTLYYNFDNEYPAWVKK